LILFFWMQKPDIGDFRIKVLGGDYPEVNSLKDLYREEDEEE
jgi:hypothetical protein